MAACSIIKHQGLLPSLWIMSWFELQSQIHVSAYKYKYKPTVGHCSFLDNAAEFFPHLMSSEYDLVNSNDVAFFPAQRPSSVKVT